MATKRTPDRCRYCGKFIDRNRPPESLCDDYPCTELATDDWRRDREKWNAQLLGQSSEAAR